MRRHRNGHLSTVSRPRRLVHAADNGSRGSAIAELHLLHEQWPNPLPKLRGRLPRLGNWGDRQRIPNYKNSLSVPQFLMCRRFFHAHSPTSNTTAASSKDSELGSGTDETATDCRTPKSPFISPLGPAEK
jgi:hypothetical protein